MLWVIAAALVAVSCSKDIQNTEAVKQGVVDYLKSRGPELALNLDAMTIDVTSVSFRGADEARATVAFRPKGIPDAAAMTMSGTLERRGNKWAVRGRLESAMPHGAGGPGAEPPPSARPPSGALPPGHPAIGTKP